MPDSVPTAVDSSAVRAAAAPPRARDRLDSAHLADPAVAAAVLAGLRQRTEATIRGAKAQATRRAYASDYGTFLLWCRRHGLAAMPAKPDTVALSLSACAEAGAAIATLRRRLVGIAQAHRAHGEASPTRHETVRQTLAGLARELGSRPRQVTPIRLRQLRAMLEAIPEDDLLALRDRALLLLGFAAALRRSELAALDVADLTFVEQGVDVLIRRSKTDPLAEGRVVGVPRGRHPETDPVLALRRWIAVAELDGGDALFPRIVPPGRRPKKPRHRAGRIAGGRLSPQGVAGVVQRSARHAGLDPESVAGHSLRSGFATEAAANGAPERAIMRQTGHRSLEMVRRYIREGDRYRENAAAYLGL